MVYLIIAITARGSRDERLAARLWWLFILLFLPYIGSIAYVLVEIVPAMFRTRAARQVGSGIGTMLDPDKEWRARMAQAEPVNSVD